MSDKCAWSGKICRNTTFIIVQYTSVSQRKFSFQLNVCCIGLSDGDHFAYEQWVDFMTQTVLNLNFLVKNVQLTNVVHPFSFNCMEKSGIFFLLWKSGDSLVFSVSDLHGYCWFQGGTSRPLEHGAGRVPEDPRSALPAAGQGDERDAGLRVAAPRTAVHRAAVGGSESRLQGFLADHSTHLRPVRRHRPGRRTLQVRRGDEVQQEAQRHFSRAGTGKSWAKWPVYTV